VTKTDYDTVLIPGFDDKLSRHGRLGIHLEIAPDFTNSVRARSGRIASSVSATTSTGIAVRSSATWN